MRLLVCGGRDYADLVTVRRYMDAAVRKGLTYVIQGEAQGADRLAKRYAAARGIPCSTEFAAAWDDVERPGAVVSRRRDGTPYDAAAGGVRNQRMLDEGKPDRVLAFPGGSGTADMIARAEAAGIKVIKVPRVAQA